MSTRNQTITVDITKALRYERHTADRQRMANALALLHKAGALSKPFIQNATEAGHRVPALFGLLMALGRGDLSVARLYEGHVNAMQIVARLGTAAQLDRVAEAAGAGGLLGVWGADAAEAPGRLKRIGGRWCVSGRKTYASGADLVEHAVVAVKTDQARTQLILLHRDDITGRLDPDWWKPIGMQATNSYAFQLDGIQIAQAMLIGAEGAYEAQPFFGAGAIRFVAAQLGGMLALWDATREHLVTSNRHEDPHQAVRLGQIVSELEAAFALVSATYGKVAASIAWQNPAGDKGNDHLFADCARVAVEAAAERITALALRSVGCAGLMDTHPLAAAARDLMVYLRQPAPDAALTRVGIGACTGTYQALFDAR